MYSSEELADIHLCYGFTNCVATEARREYARRFPNRRLPNPRTFTTTHRRLREGTLFSTTPRGRRPHYPTEMDERILETVRNDPKTSTRRVAAQLDVSQWKVWSVLNMENMHPFHTLQVQELLPGDGPKRLEFCRYIKTRLEEDPGYLKNVLWTDEATFTRSGFFNTHNDHTWAIENPRAIKPTRSQYRFSVNVWAGIIDQQLIGPYIIDGTLNSGKYLDILRDELPILLENIPLRTRQRLVFQQDGAPPHSTNAVKDFLNATFRHPWIGRNGPIAWPPRSPDLTPMDFFLWGHLKDEVYSESFETRDQLIQKNFRAVQNVRIKMNGIDLAKECKRRLEACISVNGYHFEQLLK